MVIPIALAIAFLALLRVWRHPFPDTWWSFLILVLLAALSVVVFSTWVFRKLYQLEAHILAQNTQMEALNQAALILTKELAPERVLQQIVERSREVLMARYSALSVYGQKGEASYFHAEGILQDLQEKIGSHPRGLGLLGEVQRTGVPLRVSDITLHPAYVGFPPHHPPMKAFLGVPIKSGEKVIGLLYLADKESGQVFTGDDEKTAVMFANQAAIALQNAQLFQHSQEMAEDLKALLAVGKAVGSSLNLEKVLESALETILQVTSAEYAEIWLMGSVDEVVRKCYRGAMAEIFSDKTSFRLGEGFPGIVVKTGQPIIVHDLPNDPRFIRQTVKDVGVSSMCALPLRYRDETMGALLMAAHSNRALSGHRELLLLEGIGELVAMSIKNARLHARASRLAILEERERIGMDMHDGAIQSLYAVGLGLAGVSRSLVSSHAPASKALETLMRQLDQVIQDIRSYILDVRPLSMGRNLKEFLQEQVENLRKQGPVEVSLDIAEDSLRRVPDSSGVHLVSIVAEVFSNIQRHALAAHVNVRTLSREGKVVLTIEDDGKGFDPRNIGPDKMGLRNIETRARLVGGAYEIWSHPGKGTKLYVSIPVDGVE